MQTKEASLTPRDPWCVYARGGIRTHDLTLRYRVALFTELHGPGKTKANL